MSHAMQFGRVGAFGAEMVGMGALNGRLTPEDWAMVIGLRIGHAVPKAPEAARKAREKIGEKVSEYKRKKAEKKQKGEKQVQSTEIKERGEEAMATVIPIEKAKSRKPTEGEEVKVGSKISKKPIADVISMERVKEKRRKAKVRAEVAKEQEIPMVLEGSTGQPIKMEGTATPPRLRVIRGSVETSEAQPSGTRAATGKIRFVDVVAEQGRNFADGFEYRNRGLFGRPDKNNVFTALAENGTVVYFYIDKIDTRTESVYLHIRYSHEKDFRYKIIRLDEFLHFRKNQQNPRRVSKENIPGKFMVRLANGHQDYIDCRITGSVETGKILVEAYDQYYRRVFIEYKTMDDLAADINRANGVKNEVEADDSWHTVDEKVNPPVKKEVTYRVGEEVYVKRGDGIIEKGWFIEELLADGWCKLRKPGYGRKKMPKGECWKIEEFEGRQEGDLSPQDAEISRQRLDSITQRNAVLSEGDFDKLFEGKGKSFAQKNVGNCYLISSMLSLRVSPYFEFLMRTSIKIVEGGWDVRIPLGTPNGTIYHITEKDIKPQLNPNYMKPDSDGKIDKRKFLEPVSGPIGYQILEAAFIRHLCYGSLNRLQAEGGFGHRAILRLLGNKFKKYKICGAESPEIEAAENETLMEYATSPTFYNGTGLARKKILEFLDNFDNSRFIATVGTLPSREHGHSDNYFVDDIEFACSHEYSVVNVDSANKIVYVANPWDTGHKIRLTFTQFMKAFNTLSAVKVSYDNFVSNYNQ
jgi:hypothetical protein